LSTEVHGGPLQIAGATIVRSAGVASHGRRARPLVHSTCSDGAAKPPQFSVSKLASLQVLRQLDVILSAGKVVSTGGSVSVMV
jgi:hypothetical protein